MGIREKLERIMVAITFAEAGQSETAPFGQACRQKNKAAPANALSIDELESRVRFYLSIQYALEKEDYRAQEKE